MQLQACYQLQYLSVMNDFQISHLAYIPKYLYWLSVFWEAWSNMTIATNFRTRRADSDRVLWDAKHIRETGRVTFNRDEMWVSDALPGTHLVLSQVK